MKLNYFTYYNEIKNRFVLIIFTWLSCLAICYFYKETLLFILINSNRAFLELHSQPYFIFTNVTDVFYVYLDLILFTSNQIVIIVLLYQIFMFLSLGLYNFEAIKIKLALKIFVTAWVISSILLFKIIIPFSWNFFLSFQKDSIGGVLPVSLFFEAKLDEYLKYFISLYYVSLVNCQFLAIIMVSLTNLGEKVGMTKTFRKLFYLMFVVFSTIITPPDVLSQICVSSLLILMYELLIFSRGIKASMVAN